MLLGVFKGGAGINTNVEGCGMLELANPGLLDHCTDEVRTTACGSVDVEIKRFGGIFEFGLSVDWGRGVRQHCWVYWGTSGWREY